MLETRLHGAGAASVKYDILTALAVAGLNQPPGVRISMMRLMSIITARYNWRGDEICMGQREMARLWGVGERTVKREIKRWLDAGLLICTRPGVRGRVAAYRLNLTRVCEVTRPVWSLIGSDFEARMDRFAPSENRVIRLETQRPGAGTDSGLRGWPAVSEKLRTLYPAQHEAWIAPLRPRETADALVLETTSAFAAEYVRTHFGRDIADAVAAEWGRGMVVVIRAPATAGAP